MYHSIPKLFTVHITYVDMHISLIRILKLTVRTQLVYVVLIYLSQ